MIEAANHEAARACVVSWSVLRGMGKAVLSLHRKILNYVFASLLADGSDTPNWTIW